MPSDKKKAAKAAKSVIDSDIARKIWLAGVGAYGRMYSETQDVVGKFAGNASDAFDQLVAKGEAVEDKVRESIAHSPQGEKVAAMMQDATAKMKTFSDDRRAVLDARIEKVRKTVTETLAPWNPAALGVAVDALTTQVEALTAEVAKLKKAQKAAVATPAKAPAAAPAMAATATKPAAIKAKRKAKA